jgi:hypothetical protein
MLKFCNQVCSKYQHIRQGLGGLHSAQADDEIWILSLLQWLRTRKTKWRNVNYVTRLRAVLVGKGSISSIVSKCRMIFYVDLKTLMSPVTHKYHILMKTHPHSPIVFRWYECSTTTQKWIPEVIRISLNRSLPGWSIINEEVWWVTHTCQKKIVTMMRIYILIMCQRENNNRGGNKYTSWLTIFPVNKIQITEKWLAWFYVIWEGSHRKQKNQPTNLRLLSKPVIELIHYAWYCHPLTVWKVKHANIYACMFHK